MVVQIRLDQLQFLVMDEADKLLKVNGETAEGWSQLSNWLQIGDFLKCVKRVKTHPDIV